MEKHRDSKSPKPEADGSPNGEAGVWNPEFVDRLRNSVRLAGGPTAFHAKSGIPLRTLANLLAGQEPKAGQLLAISRGCGVSLDWLMTGEGPVHPIRVDSSIAASKDFDEASLRYAIELIDVFLINRNITLPPHKKAAVTTAFYSMCLDGLLKDTAHGERTLERLVSLAS